MEPSKTIKEKPESPNLGNMIKEGQERGNNKIVKTPKPIIAPAPQKPKK